MDDERRIDDNRKRDDDKKIGKWKVVYYGDGQIQTTSRDNSHDGFSAFYLPRLEVRCGPSVLAIEVIEVIYDRRLGSAMPYPY
jgi:hypothetical protein